QGGPQGPPGCRERPSRRPRTTPARAFPCSLFRGLQTIPPQRGDLECADLSALWYFLFCCQTQHGTTPPAPGRGETIPKKDTKAPINRRTPKLSAPVTSYPASVARE